MDQARRRNAHRRPDSGFGTAESVRTDYGVDDSSACDSGFSQECTVTSINGTAIAVVVIASLLATAVGFWNHCRQGKTGSTIGKAALKFKVVSEKDGQPIGFLMSIVQQIAHAVDSLICYFGYLFPLWDQKRQTVADKIVSTVCRPTDEIAPAPAI